MDTLPIRISLPPFRKIVREKRETGRKIKKRKKRREKKNWKKKTEIPADSNWVKARATFEFHTEFVVYPVSRNEFWNEKHEGERLRYTRVYGRQIKGNKTVKLDSLLSLMEFARDKISWEYQFFEFLSTYMWSSISGKFIWNRYWDDGNYWIIGKEKVNNGNECLSYLFWWRYSDWYWKGNIVESFVRKRK